MKTVTPYLKQIIKSDKNPTPWPRMILCATASLLPLIAGYYQNQLALSIYGSLTGYLLALNDHLGQLKHRVFVIALTFLFLTLGFSIGFTLKSHPYFFEVVLMFLVYWIGILGGDGDELERGVLFSVLAMIIVFFTQSINLEEMRPIFTYCLMSFTCILIGIPILEFIHRRDPDPFLTLTESFKKSFGLHREKYMHALAYTLATLTAVWLTQYFQIERGYWIIITVLLVMRADRTQSIYKTLQRLIGTAGAVLVCDLFLPTEFHPLFLIAFVGISTFLVPIGLKKNYLFASFFVTILVLILLELAAAKHGDTTNAYFRLRATLIGCSISLLGSLISKILAIFTSKGVKNV